MTKTKIKGWLIVVVSRIGSVDRLFYFFLNRTTSNVGQRKELFVADEDTMMSPYCASIVLPGLWRAIPLKRDPCAQKQGDMSLRGGQWLCIKITEAIFKHKWNVSVLFQPPLFFSVSILVRWKFTGEKNKKNKKTKSGINNKTPQQFSYWIPITTSQDFNSIPSILFCDKSRLIYHCR